MAALKIAKLPLFDSVEDVRTLVAEIDAVAIAMQRHYESAQPAERAVMLRLAGALGKLRIHLLSII
jgi:hypothetical protein